jgi:hypothetical protein
MVDVLEWLIDISVASASAAATGSIFLLLVGVAGETRRHVVKHRDAGRMGKAQRLMKIGAIATTAAVRTTARRHQ